MNHITKSTQWEDPRITVSQLPLHQNNQHVAQISGGPGGSLPHGWEQGTTPEGEIYYIDHSTHRTQWHDPRIPQSQQPNIPQRINNQGTSQQRLLQLQREKKAVLVRFLSLYIGKVVYFSNLGWAENTLLCKLVDQSKGSCVFKWRQGMRPVSNRKTYNPNSRSKHNVEQKR